MNGNVANKKKKDGEDRISALPNTMLLEILSYLTMEEAVRSGILSKRWDHLWTQVSALTWFSGRGTRKCHTLEDKMKLFNFINTTLSLHETRSIERLCIEFPLSDKSQQEISEEEKRLIEMFSLEIDTWFRFAARRKAEFIWIYLGAYEECVPPTYCQYKVPSSFFNNDIVKFVALECCILDNAKAVCWKSLEKLQLLSIQLSDAMIELFLSGCPFLENLILRGCTGLNHLSIISTKLSDLSLYNCSTPKLRITAPNLETLVLEGDLEGYELENVSALLHLSILPELEELEVSDKRTIVGLLKSVPELDTFTCNSDALQVFSMVELNNERLPPLNCNALYISTDLCKWDLPGVIVLLRASPNLQELIREDCASTDNTSSTGKYIDEDLIQKYDSYEVNCWSTLLKSPKLINLKTVEICNFVAAPSETALVEFLLQKAPVLQKVVVHSEIPSDGMLKFTQKLLSLRKASHDAVVLFS